MTAEYALIGHPLSHSISKEYFTTKFATEGIDANYINMDIPNLRLLKLSLIKHPQLVGFNVTSPYKIDIIPYLSGIDKEAEYIGAVNTVVVEKKSVFGKNLYGYNTDIEGFTESIRPLLKPWHTKALILGTGGGAMAVRRAFKQMGIDSTTVSRTPTNGQSIGYKELTPLLIHNHSIIVNCTPLGMYPNVQTCVSIPYEAITPDHLCYDLIYAPDETLFLTKCKEQGATIKNGSDMLVIQAEASWHIWQSFAK